MGSLETHNDEGIDSIAVNVVKMDCPTKELR